MLQFFVTKIYSNGDVVFVHHVSSDWKSRSVYSRQTTHSQFC